VGVRREVSRLVSESGGPPASSNLPFSPRSKLLLEKAIEESGALGHDYVGPEHLLLGLLRVHESIAAQVLLNLKVRIDKLRATVLAYLIPVSRSVDVAPGAVLPSEKPMEVVVDEFSQARWVLRNLEAAMPALIKEWGASHDDFYESARTFARRMRNLWFESVYGVDEERDA